MQFLPGVPKAIGLLKGAGYCIFVAGNQRRVAKGLLTLGELESIHQRMCQELADAGAVIMESLAAPTKRNLLAVAANRLRVCS